MKKSSKTKVKVVVIALALLLCLALSIGVAGAWYEARRTATGTINMDTGIKIEYTGFHHETADTDTIWQKDEVDFQLFSTTSVVPGQEITLEPNTTINAAADSVAFYARFKLDYKFYTDLDGTTEATGITPSDVLIPSTNFINSAWVESGDGYYYLGSGTTLAELTPNGTPAAFFADGAKYTINPEIGGEGFGYVVNDTTTIVRADVFLTLEVAQVGTPWEITLPPVVEDLSTNVLQDESGNPVSDIVSGTTYQIVDAEQNGIKYQFAVESASTLSATIDPNNITGTATVTGYTGSPTDVVIPDYIMINEKSYEVIAIGDSFNTCGSIQRIVIGNRVKSIDERALCNCFDLKEVIIGNGVTTIGSWAFEASDCLEKVIIGSGVKSIGVGVFSSGSLKNITIEALEPPTLEGSLCAKITTVYVPAEAVEAYQAATYWSSYNIQPIA